jgi:hypothetical protein
MKFYFITTEKLDIAEEYIGCLAKTDVSKVDQDDDYGKFFVDYDDNTGLSFYSYFGKYYNINDLFDKEIYYLGLYQASNKEIKNKLLNFTLQILTEKNAVFPIKVNGTEQTANEPYSSVIPMNFIEKIKQCAFDMLIEKHGKIEFLKQAVKEEYDYIHLDPVNISADFYFCIWVLSERFGKTDDPEKFFEWFKQF